MSNSPLPRNILKPLPGHPIEKFCSHLSESSSDDYKLISSLAKAVNMYENYTEEFKCLDLYFKDEYLGASTMTFFSCAHVGDALCSNGINDMFEAFKQNKTQFIEACSKKYSIIPDSKDIRLEFGDKNSIRFSSNIIFRFVFLIEKVFYVRILFVVYLYEIIFCSNGENDVWSVGGVKKNLSDSLIAISIPNAAHMEDLFGALPEDPKPLVEARIRERSIVKKWLSQYYLN